MNSATSLVCNMGVFTPAQREMQFLNTRQLVRAIQDVQAVENGFSFTFPNETKLIARVGEFISNERLCCPFLKFTLTVFSNEEPVSLSISGPTGTQDFLRAEFSGVFQ